MAFKKSIKASEIKEGDDFIVYHHSSPSAQTVKPLYFHVNEIRMGTYIRCTRLREDGRMFRDYYHNVQDVDFTRHNNNDNILITKSFDDWSPYSSGTYYLDPDIPCGLVINKLIEKKRKLNKSIVDCQNLMHAVENDV